MDQGERVDVELPGGSIFRAIVTSTPIIEDGKVIAALSIRHGFDKDIRELAEKPEQMDWRGAGEW